MGVWLVLCKVLICGLERRIGWILDGWMEEVESRFGLLVRHDFTHHNFALNTKQNTIR